MPDPTNDRLDVALRLAEEASEAVLERYQSPDLRVETKPDGSPVTEADLRAHEIIAAGVTDAFADDGLLSEEAPEHAGTSRYRWVVDPIDGTSSYQRGVPLFSILIGIELDGVPAGGVAAMPALGEMVWGQAGAGAHWRRRDGSVVPASVSGGSDLAGATIEAASPTAFLKHGLGEVYMTLAGRVRKLRGWSEGVAFALLATGRIDAGVSVSMSRWDVSAFVPIVGEAGGCLTGWDGRPAVDSSRMLGTNGRLRGPLEALLGG